MFKPLSQLNWFFKLALERTLSGSDQLVYLHIFNKFNQAHWTETILVHDADLRKLINWYESTGKPASIDTVRKAKARLKKKGFLDFEATPSGTKYKLIRLYPTDTPADTPTDTPTDSSARSYIHVREDVLEVKTKDILSSTRAREDIDEVMDFWEKAGGAKLTFEHLSELQVLLKKHGLTWLKDKIKEASDSNGSRFGLSMKFFRSVASQKPKGGTTHDTYNYALPDTI